MNLPEYRKYVPGDDTRRLDWRAYARSDRFYIKEFEADTNLRMCLIVRHQWLDGLFAGRRQQASVTLGKSAAHWLASPQHKATRSGLYCAGAEFHKEIPPKRNAKHLGVVLDELADLRATGETGLIAALHDVAEKVSQRALIVVISDLFVDPEELRSCFGHLRFRKHDVVAFHLMETSELEFEFNRPMRFLDMEGGAHILADPNLIASQYRSSLDAYLADITEVVREAAVDYHHICIDEPYDKVLARFLLGRMTLSS